ncbi:hypothetical protein P1P91_03620 [Halomonas piscis]|uniref:Uncharacterized protein n=1 Tax=Halomonas piscis TaxID=3031727 RepID=A0ABY9Z256_9GAMM|nr:hypothetical protein [Halomonas piscis]WNK20780.1 hypothetical protein P1P91_03620 [Halomonas piscis]
MRADVQSPPGTLGADGNRPGVTFGYLKLYPNLIHAEPGVFSFSAASPRA